MERRLSGLSRFVMTFSAKYSYNHYNLRSIFILSKSFGMNRDLEGF